MIIILNNQVSDNQDIVLILIISGYNLFILKVWPTQSVIAEKNNNWFTPIFNTQLV